DEKDVSGTWYVDVVDPHTVEFTVPFKLLATFVPDPDPSLLALPKPPGARTPLERALLSTVEVIDDEGGGSGVVISDKGWILTNYHVIQDKVETEGLLGNPIAIALTV